MKNSLSRVDGVGEVNVYSARLSMRVWLDADKLGEQVTDDLDGGDGHFIVDTIEIQPFE